MSEKMFENRSLHCPICTRYIGRLTPDLIKKAIGCSKCGTRFQIQALSVKDWEKPNGRKGLSLTMGISAVVDNPVDRENIKQYDKSSRN